MPLLRTSKSSLWDSLAERFNTHKGELEMHPDAAVNIYVGWPTFFDQVKRYTEETGIERCRILDFGCGAGRFCRELSILGHEVFGVDSSVAMSGIAHEKVSHVVNIYNGVDSLKTLEELGFQGTFDIITSIHSLEWNKDQDRVLNQIQKFLKPGGMLIFAVFPKAHVRDSLRIKDLFEDFDSVEDPSVGFANFDGIRVPVYIKGSLFYDDHMKKIGMKKFLEFYPSYPKNFLRDFKWTGSLEPEMVILGYRMPSR